MTSSIQFASRTSRHDITITSRRTETTIGAAAFFQRTAILHVTTDLVRVLEPGECIGSQKLWMSDHLSLDASERQSIKDMDGVPKRPKIRYCCISDPFVLVLRDDDTLGLFVGDAERGRIRRKDMTPMGDKVQVNENRSDITDNPYVIRPLDTLRRVSSQIKAVYLNLGRILRTHRLVRKKLIRLLLKRPWIPSEVPNGSFFVDHKA
jgi:hypothetical protein